MSSDVFHGEKSVEMDKKGQWGTNWDRGGQIDRFLPEGAGKGFFARG